MLSFMRKHARSWFIKVLLGTVIIVFIFFYGFSLRERASAVVLVVNGTKIAQREFQRHFDRLLEIQRTATRELTSEQRKLLKEATLESLIQQTLLLEQADKWKIRVTQQEIMEQTRQVPFFQEGGQFSLRLFQHYLRGTGQTEAEFLRDLERDLRVQKVEQLVRDGAWVSEEEVETMYRLLQEKVVIQYVSLPARRYLKEISLAEEEIRTYFQDQLARYRLPETVKVEFMAFEPQMFSQSVNVSEREIQDFYDRNRDRWREEGQVLARQILIRSTEKEDEKARMKALQKAEEILKKLKSGEDFAKLARENSQDPQSSGKGGSMGWKKRKDLPEPLARALFEEMKVGEISQRPVKTALGFHLLRLDELRPERLRNLEEVRPQIEAEIRQIKARQMALEKAEEAYLEVFQGNGFREVAQKLNARLGQTDPFSLQEPLKEPKAGEDFRKAAFLLRETEDFSEVVEDSGVFYVIQLLERTPSRDPSLEEVRQRVEEDLRLVKAMERSFNEARGMIERLNSTQGSLEVEARKLGLDLTTSPPLGRTAPAQGIPTEMAQEALSMRPGQTILPKPFRQGEMYLVGQIKERIPADPKGLEEQRPLIRGLLLRNKADSLFRDWIEKLRSRSDIRTFRAYEELL